MINGSPHEKGCTYTALTEVGKGLAEYGLDYEILWLGEGDIRGCTGCGFCSKTGLCAFDDIVNEAIGKMGDSDGLVVGSPVYFASPSGQLMSFLDRFYYAGDCFSGKPAAAVVNARRAGTTAALDVLNKYLGYSGAPLVTSTYWNMTHGFTPEQVRQDAEGLQTMRNLGRNMGWLIRSIAAGKEAGIAPPNTERGARTNFI